MPLNPYDELGLRPDASGDEIKAAHRKMVKKHHPDAAGGSQEKFGAIQRSYELLSDTDQRERFDRTGQTEDTSFRQKESQILTAVIKLLSLAINEAMDLETTDVKAILQETLREGSDKLNLEHGETKAKLLRLEKMERRFKRKKRKGKAGADDADRESAIFKLATASMFDTLTKHLAKVEEAKALHERVVGVFEAFDYDFKPPAPAQHFYQPRGFSLFGM